MPEDKLKDLTFDKDAISINVSPVGQVSMRIVERDEPKTIKFASENSTDVVQFLDPDTSGKRNIFKDETDHRCRYSFLCENDGIWTAERGHREDCRGIGNDTL